MATQPKIRSYSGAKMRITFAGENINCQDITLRKRMDTYDLSGTEQEINDFDVNKAGTAYTIDFTAIVHQGMTFDPDSDDFIDATYMDPKRTITGSLLISDFSTRGGRTGGMQYSCTGAFCGAVRKSAGADKDA